MNHPFGWLQPLRTIHQHKTPPGEGFQLHPRIVGWHLWSVFCWSRNKSSWWLSSQPIWTNMIVKMGNLPQIGVKIGKYLSCHRLELLYYKACQDMTFSKTFSFKTTNPIVGLLILQTQPESREVWRELHFPQISRLFPAGVKNIQKHGDVSHFEVM